MFDDIMTNVRRIQAEFDFEMARCADMYRLNKLLSDHMVSMKALLEQSDECIIELEEL